VPVIDPTLFKGVADRLAKQYSFFVDAICSASEKGGGLYYPRVHDGTPVGGNFPVESDLISAANSTDNLMHDSGIPADQFFSTLITALNNHVTNAGATNLSDYCNRSGVTVSFYYEDAYYQVTGSHMLGRTVFSPNDQLTMATVDFSASGVATFTDGVALGAGSGDVSPTNYAAGMLGVVVQSGVVNEEAILDIRLTTDKYPTGIAATSRVVDIPVGTAAGEQISVGTSGIDRFNDVTNIVVAGGENGLSVKVLYELERTIGL
jgi:hypothetical protein